MLYASPSGADAGTCTRTQTCSITRAIQLADATRNTVKLLPGTYTATPTVSAKTVVIHGYGATINAIAGARSIEIDNGAHLRLLGMNFVNINANGVGISCQPSVTNPKPVLELEEVSVDAVDTALVAYPCTVTVSRSRFVTRTSTDRTIAVLPTSSLTLERSLVDGGDGIWVEGTTSVASITNSVIKNQTGPEGAFIGSNLFGNGPGSVFVRFTTVINSRVRCGGAPPACAGGSAIGSCIENSIVFNGSSSAPPDTVESGCTATYSVVYPQSTALSGSNNQLGVNPAFTDFTGADYHLANGSPAIDAADPAASNMVDFDGVARPQGARSDIGAFEFK